MPALPSFLIAPIWEQLVTLLPDQRPPHPLIGHRPRIADRVVFDKLVQVLVFGCAYARIADECCSATTIRRRRDEWIQAGVMTRLEELVRGCYDRLIGLQLDDLVVDGCITKAPCGGELAGRSPVDRGKQGLKRSLVVDAAGIPLGVVLAPANRHDSPLLAPTLDLAAPLLEPGIATAHLDRGYDSDKTRATLAERQLIASISPLGKPAPIRHGQRWVVERTNAWHNAFKKLVWCTERRAAVIAFYVAFASVVIIVRRLIREGWRRYRWDGRPSRCP
ncbi:MAG: IS5 family transposase [Pseudonocardiaceae bacterium]